MSSTGNVFAGTGENNAGIGATAWTTPGNVTADDAADATCNAGASSNYLVARNFGFSVPSEAIIQGITVRVEASEHTAGTEGLNAQLQNDSGTLVGSSKSVTISGTGKSVYTYGSTSDVWGASLTPAIVNDADFGVRLWFTTAHDIRIDFVTIAVEYIIPAGDDSGDVNGAGGLVYAARKSYAGALATAAFMSMLAGQIYDDQLVVPQTTTRFYADVNTSISPIPSAAVDAGWDTSGSANIELVREKLGSESAFGIQPTITSTGVSSSKHELTKLVSRRLAAGQQFTTSDKIKIYVLAMQNQATTDIKSFVTAKIISEDGSVVRATLLALGHYGNSSEFPLTFTNRAFAVGTYLQANYLTVEGDRIQIELGGQVDTDGGTADSFSLQFFAFYGNTDVGENETDTVVTDSWVEFSRTLEFDPVVWEDDTPRQYIQPRSWLAPRFVQVAATATFLTIEEEWYLPPKPWPAFALPITPWADGDDAVTPILEIEDTEPPSTIHVPAKHQWLTLVDDEIVPQSVPDPIYEDDTPRTIILGQRWLASIFMQPQDTATYVTVDEEQYQPPKPWPDRYLVPSFQGEEEALTPPTPLNVDDNVWQISGFTRSTNYLFAIWQTDDVVQPPPPLAADDDAPIRWITGRSWLAPLFLQPQPRTDFAAGIITSWEDDWNVGRHKPYHHSWIKTLFDPADIGFETVHMEDGWPPDTVWPQVTTFWFEPDAGNDVVRGISVDEIYQHPLANHVAQRYAQAISTNEDLRSSSLAEDETGHLLRVKWNWSNQRAVIADDEIANAVGLDEDYNWVGPLWPTPLPPRVFLEADEDTVIGINVDEIYEQLISRHVQPKLSVQPVLQVDEYVFVTAIDDYYGITSFIQWTHKTPSVFTDDGNAIQKFGVDEQQLRLPQWAATPLVRPVTVDDVIAFEPTPLPIDEEYQHQFTKWNVHVLPYVQLDDDVIAEPAPPLGVDEIECGPLPPPKHVWRNGLYWFDDLPWAANVSLAPARLDAIASEVLSGGNGPPQAQLSGVALEVLYVLPVQPVRITNSKVWLFGTLDASAEVTQDRVDFLGSDANKEVHVTWDHVDFSGWSQANGSVTWLHVDVLITRGPIIPPEEECPTTPYDCIESPPPAPMTCAVAVPMFCNPVTPEAIISVPELPCPPIGEDLGVGTIPSEILIPYEEQNIVDDEGLWPRLTWFTAYNRIILWGEDRT